MAAPVCIESSNYPSSRETRQIFRHGWPPSPGVSKLVDAVAFSHSYGAPETHLRNRSDTRRSFLPGKRTVKPTVADTLEQLQFDQSEVFSKSGPPASSASTVHDIIHIRFSGGLVVVEPLTLM